MCYSKRSCQFIMFRDFFPKPNVIPLTATTVLQEVAFLEILAARQGGSDP